MSGWIQTFENPTGMKCIQTHAINRWIRSNETGNHAINRWIRSNETGNHAIILFKWNRNSCNKPMNSFKRNLNSCNKPMNSFKWNRKSCNKPMNSFKGNRKPCKGISNSFNNLSGSNSQFMLFVNVSLEPRNEHWVNVDDYLKCFNTHSHRFASWWWSFCQISETNSHCSALIPFSLTVVRVVSKSIEFKQHQNEVLLSYQHWNRVLWSSSRSLSIPRISWQKYQRG